MLHLLKLLFGVGKGVLHVRSFAAKHLHHCGMELIELSQSWFQVEFTFCYWGLVKKYFIFRCYFFEELIALMFQTGFESATCRL